MYTLDHFIKKFEAIPETQWIVGNWSDGNDGHCAAGHCKQSDAHHSPEVSELGDILRQLPVTIIAAGNGWGLSGWGIVTAINDAFTTEYQQPTPKQRILAALYDIKKSQEPVYDDITSALAVLPVNETSDLKPYLESVK